MIKVIVVDDQPMIRDGIKLIIEEDPEIQVVGLGGNGREALELCERCHPDLVLMDIVMPGCDGAEGTGLIKARYPTIAVIILTTFNDMQHIEKALQHGADGYLLKDIESADLLLAIRGVRKGLSVLNRNIFDAIVKQPRQSPEVMIAAVSPSQLDLSEREIAIIRLIVFGKSNKEIAAELSLNEGSIRNIISGILAKLDLKDRTQLAVFAMRQNLV